MRIIKSTDFKHQQLKSQKTGELYSLSDVISEKTRSKQLFFHHDIIMPITKSSGAHRHTIIEEVVYVLKGTVTAVSGKNKKIVEEGDFIIFEPKEKELHLIFNQSDQVAETLTFSIESEFDFTIFDESQSDMERPGVHFNQDLQDIPNDSKQWDLFLVELKANLKSEKHPEKILSLYEHIGMVELSLFRKDTFTK